MSYRVSLGGVKVVLLTCVVAVFAPSYHLFAQNELSGLSSLPSEKSAPPPACAPAPKDPSVWDKSVTAGYNYTEGNSNASSLNANAKVSRDFDNNSWRFEADYNRGDAAATPDSGRTTTVENARGIADYKRIFDDTWFSGVGGSIFHDEIADLRYRGILSPGIGAFLVRNDDVKLSLEVGPSYVWEKKGSESDNFLAPRIANRFSYKLSETARIFQTAEYLISADDSSNYIITAEAGLEAALTSLVNIVFIVRDNYINSPAAGRQPNDVQTITGLKINL
jgi:putative salt-induced outer membrane protein YdiY